jgi:hypothetical protein
VEENTLFTIYLNKLTQLYFSRQQFPMQVFWFIISIICSTWKNPNKYPIVRELPWTPISSSNWKSSIQALVLLLPLSVHAGIRYKKPEIILWSLSKRDCGEQRACTSLYCFSTSSNLSWAAASSVFRIIMHYTHKPKHNLQHLKKMSLIHKNDMNAYEIQKLALISHQNVILEIGNKTSKLIFCLLYA